MTSSLSTRVPSPPSLRVRIGWLHAWVGFVAGLMLVCIFITGTLGTFDTEITRWMQPEFASAIAPIPSPTALDRAAQLAAEHEQPHQRLSINLPSARDPSLRVAYTSNGEMATLSLDPQTGAIIPVRDTAGGTLFFRFHYTLHMGRFWGVMLVQVLGICLMVILGSGLVMHLRALLPGLVTFRPTAPSPRPWIDAHVLAAVLFMPFFFMVAYTGVMIHADRFFPVAGTEGPRHGEGRGERHEGGPVAAPIAPLSPLLEEARRVLGENGIGFLQIDGNRISVIRADEQNLPMTRDRLEFDRTTGEKLRLVQQKTPAMRAKQIMSGVHMARWASPAVRGLYFLSGFAGTVMMSTGLVLFLITRRRRNPADASHALRIAEGLALGTIAGLPLACASVFWANRLLPATLVDRAADETLVLFGMWAACIVHGLGRALGVRVLQGWREQFTLLAGLLCFLPVLDIATRWPWMKQQDQSVYAVLDMVALALGLAAFAILKRLRDGAAKEKQALSEPRLEGAHAR